MVHTVQTGANTAVRMLHCDTYNFEIGVGFHQGSLLSSLLFIIVLHMICSEIYNEDNASLISL